MVIFVYLASKFLSLKGELRSSDCCFDNPKSPTKSFNSLFEQSNWLPGTGPGVTVRSVHCGEQVTWQNGHSEIQTCAFNFWSTLHSLSCKNSHNQNDWWFLTIPLQLQKAYFYLLSSVAPITRFR